MRSISYHNHMKRKEKFRQSYHVPEDLCAP